MCPDNLIIWIASLFCVASYATTVRYKILEGENFDKFGKLQVIRQKFLAQNPLNICETVWMALLNYS